MTAPRSFQLHEGEGDLYAVTISARRGRGGRSFLHTFAYRERAIVDGMNYGENDCTWVVATPLTRRQVEAAEKRESVIRAMVVTERRMGGGEFGDDLVGESFSTYSESGAPLPVHLASGIDVPPPVLSAILDALRFGQRHEVDIEDIKLVVSQLGARIARLHTLPDGDTREIAKTALYSEILQRCSTL